jgi:hypothetical protein
MLWVQAYTLCTIQHALCMSAFPAPCCSDLLRGKLSQLEHNVLAAAASSTGGAPAFADATNEAAGPAAAGSRQGGVLDLRSLLQSLGLGEEVVGALTDVGGGPSGPAGGPAADSDGEQQLQQQQRHNGQAWQQAADMRAGVGLRYVAGLPMR